MIYQGITVYWRVFTILLLLNFATACTNQKVVLPYNEPPVDLQTPISSIRVDSFSVGSSKYGENFRDTLVALLTKEGAIQILTKGAESELSGQVNIGRIDQNSHRESYKTEEKINDKKVEVTKYTYFYRKSLTASVTYQLKKGSKIIGSNSFETQFDKTWSGESAASAKAEASTDQQVINQSLKILAMHIVRGISSHETAVQFKMQLGSLFSPNEGLETGVEYYQQGLYGQAESYWQQVIDNEADPKLKAAANFNLGVNQFREKNFEEAFKFFRKADQLDPVNKEYMAAISHTESS
jgi:tetratricopeptide (TPR) repeat protein